MRAILAAAVVVMAGAVAGGAGAKEAGALRAIAIGPQTSTLLELDARTLSPAGRRLRIGSFGRAWSVDPSRSRLVVGHVWRPTVARPAALRFVDLPAGRVAWTLSLRGETGEVSATAWAGSRVLVLLRRGTGTALAVVDPERRQVVKRVDLRGRVLRGARSGSELVVLLAPREAIGPARLAVIDGDGQVRAVTLARIAAGTVTTVRDGAEPSVSIREPALALGPRKRTAYVVGTDAPAAAVDLRTLEVAYAAVRAPAKLLEGSTRAAAALPDGRLVVGGLDYGGDRAQISVGVDLVDPRSWSSRELDPDANGFVVAGSRVFCFSWGAGASRFVEQGLRVWNASGARSLELLRGEAVGDLQVVGDRALVTLSGRGFHGAVVDLASGRVVRRTTQRLTLLSGSGAGIWG